MDLVVPWKTLFTSVYERRKGGPLLLSSSFSLAWTKMAFKINDTESFVKASRLTRICQKKGKFKFKKFFKLSTQLDIHFLRKEVTSEKTVFATGYNYCSSKSDSR